jgi:hypothetical protein
MTAGVRRGFPLSMAVEISGKKSFATIGAGCVLHERELRSVRPEY